VNPGSSSVIIIIIIMISLYTERKFISSIVLSAKSTRFRTCDESRSFLSRINKSVVCKTSTFTTETAFKNKDR